MLLNEEVLRNLPATVPTYISTNVFGLTLDEMPTSSGFSMPIYDLHSYIYSSVIVLNVGRSEKLETIISMV